MDIGTHFLPRTEELLGEGAVMAIEWHLSDERYGQFCQVFACAYFIVHRLKQEDEGCRQCQASNKTASQYHLRYREGRNVGACRGGNHARIVCCESL